MVSERVVVTNKSGIHARPACELASVAKQCDSDVVLIVGERVVNPKSILNLMAAAIHKGMEITVQCDGETEEADLKRILDAIKGGLGEDEY